MKLDFSVKSCLRKRSAASIRRLQRIRSSGISGRAVVPLRRPVLCEKQGSIIGKLFRCQMYVLSTFIYNTPNKGIYA